MDAKTEKIVESMIPYFPDDSRKSKYLGYRVCGFGVREAIALVGVTETTVRNWRKADPQFEVLDLSGINELKKKLGAEFINLEFTRNFHLILQKDFNILFKSVRTPDKLTDRENQYLLKLRQFYTPQQYAVIQQLIGEAQGEGFNFTDLVFQIRKERSELIVGKGVAHHALPKMSGPDATGEDNPV